MKIKKNFVKYNLKVCDFKIVIKHTLACPRAGQGQHPGRWTSWKSSSSWFPQPGRKQKNKINLKSLSQNLDNNWCDTRCKNCKDKQKIKIVGYWKKEFFIQNQIFLLDANHFFGFFAIFTSAMLTFLRWEFERTFLSTIQPVVEVSRNGRQVAFVDLNFHQKISKQISSETKQILKEFCIVTCWMLEKNMSRIFRYQISIFKVV